MTMFWCDTQLVVVGWCSGCVLVSINEVNLRRARLVLEWVTMSGFSSLWGTFISICDKTPRSTQPGHPFVGRRNEYQPKGGDALRLRSKGRYGLTCNCVLTIAQHRFILINLLLFSAAVQCCKGRYTNTSLWLCDCDCVWVAGKTVWSRCYTWAISECFRDKELIIKRYINSSVLQLTVLAGDGILPWFNCRHPWRWQLLLQ